MIGSARLFDPAHRVRRARGLTLLELMVVIAIMGLATAGVSLAMRDTAGEQLSVKPVIKRILIFVRATAYLLALQELPGDEHHGVIGLIHDDVLHPRHAAMPVCCLTSSKEPALVALIILTTVSKRQSTA